MCPPATSVEILKLAESEFNPAVPNVTCVPPVVSINVTLPVAVVEVASVAVTDPLPYATTEGPLSERAPGVVLPSPAMV